MLSLAIALARYYFLFLIAYFLIMAIGGDIKKKQSAVPSAAVLLFCFCAFALLSWQKNSCVAYIYAGGGFCAVLAAILISGRISKARAIYEPALFLLAIGLVTLFRLNEALFFRQLIYAAIGLAISFCAPLAMRLLRRFETSRRLFLAFMAPTLLLLLCALFGGTELYGARNWLSVGGFSFQPSEPAKLTYIFSIALALPKKASSRRVIAVSAFAAACCLALALAKDMGGAALFFFIYLSMIYAATGSFRIIAPAICAAAAASVAAYHAFSHVRDRVTVWLNPWADIDASGYQITQSLFAVATFGLFGAGLSRGVAIKIPVVERDVIFSAICEEFGALFGLCLIGVFALLALRAIKTAVSLKASKSRESLIATGITAMISTQAFTSIAGNLKLVPMTGVTLPFISYGGSSVIVCISAVGVICAIIAPHDKSCNE